MPFEEQRRVAAEMEYLDYNLALRMKFAKARTHKDLCHGGQPPPLGHSLNHSDMRDACEYLRTPEALLFLPSLSSADDRNSVSLDHTPLVTRLDDATPGANSMLSRATRMGWCKSPSAFGAGPLRATVHDEDNAQPFRSGEARTSSIRRRLGVILLVNWMKAERQLGYR